MIKTFKTINVENYDLARVQDSAKETFGQLTNLPILNGILIEGVSLTTGGDNLVETRLGRPWTAWIIARNTANAVVYEGTLQTNKNKFLNLNTTANTTVSLWVI